MDRHAAYVGLTRHREGVALHYARDEFADAAQLARVLGRERAKDTTLDYGGGELAERYAVRRGLVPESEIVRRGGGGQAGRARPSWRRRWRRAGRGSGTAMRRTSGSGRRRRSATPRRGRWSGSGTG